MAPRGTAQPAAGKSAGGKNKSSRSTIGTAFDVSLVLVGLALIASALNNVPVKVTGLVNVELSAPGALLAQIAFGIAGAMLALRGFGSLLNVQSYVVTFRKTLSKKPYLSSREQLTGPGTQDRSRASGAKRSATPVITTNLAMRTKIVIAPDGTRTETREYFTQELAFQQILQDSQGGGQLITESDDVKSRH